MISDKSHYFFQSLLILLTAHFVCYSVHTQAAQSVVVLPSRLPVINLHEIIQQMGNSKRGLANKGESSTKK